MISQKSIPGMRSVLLFLAATLFLFACNNSSNKSTQEDTSSSQEKKSFFPVTAYLKGQIYDITQKHVNPLKYTTIDNKTDSVWIKAEEMNQAFTEFLTPEIDSTNLTPLFSETKFLDRSYGDAFTFTYDPVKELPDTFSLSHWVVYIDAQTSNVKKIYMVKRKGDKETQLTWKSGNWCSIVTIINNADGTSKVEKEEKIVWNF
jgi:hypothetical protein